VGSAVAQRIGNTHARHEFNPELVTLGPAQLSRQFGET